MVYPKKLDAKSIICSAFELLDSQGIDGLSMRKLAQVLSVSVSSLYRYFPERTILLQALEADVSQELRRLLQSSINGLQEADAFIQTAYTYLDYARTKPERYALLLQVKSNSTVYPAAQENAKALWNQVLEIVSAVTGDHDDTAATVAFWSFLHGFIALEQSGNFGESGPKGGFEQGLQALLKGFKK